MTKLTKAIKENKKYDLIILDGKNLSFRYFCGMSNLTNKDGERTGLYHGFLSAVLKLKLAYPKARIIVAWEGGKLVKSKIVKEYKADRHQNNGELSVAIKKLTKMLGMMEIEQKYSQGYEADDVAATLCSHFKGNILLISGDGDWMQMMNIHRDIKMKRDIISYEKLKKTMGFNPEKIIIYDAIRGGHNNLKGISGFPLKLAGEIVKQSANIKDIYDFVPRTEVELKWMKVLKASQDIISSNYWIMKLKTNTELKDLSCPGKNLKRLKSLLRKDQLNQVKNLLEKTES